MMVHINNTHVRHKFKYISHMFTSTSSKIMVYTFLRLIVNLTSRLEVIEVDMKQSRRVSVAARPSGDNGKPEMTPRHHRRWTASSDQRRWSSESVISLPDSQRGSFTWQMPFTLKCIGTFRSILLCVMPVVMLGLSLLTRGVVEPDS